MVSRLENQCDEAPVIDVNLIGKKFQEYKISRRFKHMRIIIYSVYEFSTSLKAEINGIKSKIVSFFL